MTRRTAAFSTCLLFMGCVEFPEGDPPTDTPQAHETAPPPETVGSDVEADVQDAGPNSVLVVSVSATSGGTNAAAGAALTAPAGAVAQDVVIVGDPSPTLTSAPVKGMPSSFASQVSAESAWTFGPESLALLKPVKITLPYAGEAYSKGPIPVLVYTADKDRWNPARGAEDRLVTAQPVAGGVQFEVDELGTYAFVRGPEALLECVGEVAITCLANQCIDPDGEPIEPSCNDGNPCNGEEACDPDHGCLPGTPLVCADDDVCDGEETCNATLGCVDGTPPACDDQEPCNGTETCDAVLGCTPGPALVCSDKDACNGLETCDVGVGCTPGTALTCEDSNTCNGSETCSAQAGCLAGTPVVGCCSSAADCDDDSVCNGTGFCDVSTNTCVLAAPPICDDGNICNGQETCDTATGCVPGPPLNCSDGNICDGLEFCQPGVGCIEGTVPVCNDGNPCNGHETCQALVGCVSAPPPVCNDGNICNGLDSCDPEAGCVSTEPMECDDGKPCTGQELCHPQQGCLPGEPPEGCCLAGDTDCEDGDPCNGLAACDDETLTCTLGDPIVCGDTNPCNGVETCDHKSGGCLPGAPAKCDDGNVCNGFESCDPETGCSAGDLLICDDGDPCNGQEVCDPTTNCIPGAALMCDDGNPCNGAESCVDGDGCAAGPALSCDDGDACNGQETCDPATACGPGIAPTCVDLDKCNGIETCDPAVGCLTGAALDCDDGDLCTTDACDPAIGCSSKVSEECSLTLASIPGQTVDKSAVTGLALSIPGDATDTSVVVEILPAPGLSAPDDDVVSPHTFAPDGTVFSAPLMVTLPLPSALTVGQSIPVVILDSDAWVAATTPAGVAILATVGLDGLTASFTITHFSAYALATGCAPTICKGDTCAEQTLDCDDGDACTGAEACADGQCASGPALDCDDNTPCTSDSCVPDTGCAWASDDQAACDDGDACTTNDGCIDGGCAGTGLDCDDGNACTADSCDSAGGCANIADDQAACDDGDACFTDDACSGGTCQGVAKNCDDSSPCTTNTCDPDTGCQTTPDDDGICDDNNVCNGAEACADGVCVGGQAMICDDLNDCTQDGCDPNDGCTIAPDDTGPCGDGDDCTTDDSCSDGSCSGIPLDCSNGDLCSIGACVPVIGCKYEPIDCGDGSACTSESCVPDEGCVTTPVVCPDPDTSDCLSAGCDPQVGCTLTPTAAGATCDDDNPCSSDDVCDSEGGCDGEDYVCPKIVCLLETCGGDGGCAYLPATGACDDQNACTSDDTCVDAACVGTPGICVDHGGVGTFSASSLGVFNAVVDGWVGSASGTGAVTAETDPGRFFLSSPTGGASASVKAQGGATDLRATQGSNRFSFTAHNGQIRLQLSDGTQAVTVYEPLAFSGGIGWTLSWQSPNSVVLANADGQPVATADVTALTSVHMQLRARHSGVPASASLYAFETCTDTCYDGLPCTQDLCDPAGGCSNTPDNALCNDDDICTTDACVAGACVHTPGQCVPSCADVPAAFPGAQSGVYPIDPDGDGVSESYLTHCDLDTDGGGWALAAVFADDGNPTFVWANKAGLTDFTLVGDVADLTSDYIGRAMQHASAHDLLVVHRPSGIWASYNGVWDSIASLGFRIENAGGPNCYNGITDGFAMSAGTLTASGDLCSTRMFLNPADQEGGDQASCSTLITESSQHAWGPAWNAKANFDGCLFDEVAEVSGVGFNAADPAVESDASGFGKVLNLNVGQPGSGENRLEIYVRALPGCADCPKDCQEALEADPTASQVRINPTGDASHPGTIVQCSNEHDDGAWTLVAVSSDDGQDHWTWDARHLWDTDTTAFGTLSDLTRDYKSPALHDMPATDVLFVHEPSGQWASYHDITDGSVSLATLIEQLGATCYDASPGGIEMSAGTLVQQGDLCDTRLYFNARDKDGKGPGEGCTEEPASGINDTWGPSWSTGGTDGCPFDDPGRDGALGPQSGSPDQESARKGFAWSQGLDIGVPGTGQNRISVYVRTPHGCDGAPAGETCNDNNACTVLDGCDGQGQCAGTEIGCSDSDPCTDNSCDPATGCVTAPSDCEDDNACTTDTCHSSLGCVSFAEPGPTCTADGDCDDGNPCTTDGCAADACHYQERSCADEQGDHCSVWVCDTDGGLCQSAGSVDCDADETCAPASGCGAVCEACGNDGDCTGGQPNEVGACRAGCCRYGLPAEVCGNPFDENGDGVQDEDCTWFVDAAALLGGDGTTWDQAFTTLNAATTAANAGDRVWVASATYISADASPILVMKQGVDIYGGFIGDETAMAQRPSPLAETALDGTFSTPQIALAAPSARLDGFILRNAAGNASGAGLAGNGVTGLTVTDCTFDSNTGFQGGAFYNVTGGGGSENRFERVVFSNNTVTSDGGAVHTLGPVSARVFVDCQFINNTASGLGGAMRLTAPTLLERCTFVSNRSTGSAAGAIHHATASYLTIVDSTFAQNEAATVAGAISTESAATTLSITGTLFQGNQAISAGAIRARFSTLDITASVFEANSATSGHGGAITVEESLFTLNSSRFSNNTASGEGGGIRASTLTAGTTADTQWQCNTAGTFGGALRATDSPLVLHNPTFYGNGAANGGGLAVSGGVGGGVEISGARLTHNSATGSGGAIHCASATLTVEHSDVAANAANLGAGVYSDCVTTVVNSGFDSNAATTAGGGLHLGTANDSTLLSNTLVNNTSPTGSGSSGGTSIRNSVVWNNQLDNPGSSSNICTPDTDPIERGPHQQLFLTPTSTCINAGNAQHNTDLFSDWANWTTQSDGTLDSPPLDAGRHYTP